MIMKLSDVYTIEGETEATEAEYFQAIQRAINSGAWALQGSYGRIMMDAINSGYCMLGQNRARDYYGNTIPARDDVQAGTKGSPEFVEAHHGAEWRAMMEGV